MEIGRFAEYQVSAETWTLLSKHMPIYSAGKGKFLIVASWHDLLKFESDPVIAELVQMFSVSRFLLSFHAPDADNDLPPD